MLRRAAMGLIGRSSQFVELFFVCVFEVAKHYLIKLSPFLHTNGGKKWQENEEPRIDEAKIAKCSLKYTP